MIKSYRFKARIFFDGEEVHRHNLGIVLKEETNIASAPKKWEYTNLKEAMEAPLAGLGIYTWTWKKLFKKEFYGLEVESQPFMWSSLDKKPHTLIVEYDYIPYEASLKEIFDYHDVTIAIQYLKERGLAVCPIGK